MRARAEPGKGKRPLKILRAVAGWLSFLLAFAAHAQDLAVQAGVTRSADPRATSYGWAASYSHDLGAHLFGSFTYQNEGHVPSHHRDGHSVQIWARTSLFTPQLSLAAGVGPHHYFDTTVAENPSGFADAHGWGVMYSVSATWRLQSSPWFYQLRVNRIETKRNLDTTALLFGAGYRLEQDGSFKRNATTNGWKDRNDEIVLMAGQTIVNSFESQSSLAKSVEYRYGFTPVLRGAIGWVAEGDARLIRRGGIIAQGWFEPSFYEDRFTLGLGYGAYFAVDEYHSGPRKVQGILSTTFSYHVARGWLGRITWHRIASTYDRDSDIILLGVGYRF